MTLRVLLAAPQSDFAHFLRDVLTELDGSPHWGEWVNIEAFYGTTWSEAADALAGGAVDALLLDPDLPDSQGADTFRRAQAIAPQVPVVLLVEREFAALAGRMVRDGAQDFLLKDEVDCVPLVRAIRNSLERHRVLTAARATAMTDSLTGLLTSPAFLILADRDRRLAEQLNRKLLVVVAEAGLDHDTQRRDLFLVEAADGLRRMAGSAGLVGRLDDSRFALAVWDTEAEPIEEIRGRLASVRAGDLKFGVAVFDPQEPVSLETLLDQATGAAPRIAIMAESAHRPGCDL